MYLACRVCFLDQRPPPSHPVQAEAGSECDHHPHCRLQRGDCHLQERQVQRLGECMRVCLFLHTCLVFLFAFDFQKFSVCVWNIIYKMIQAMEVCVYTCIWHTSVSQESLNKSTTTSQLLLYLLLPTQ